MSDFTVNVPLPFAITSWSIYGPLVCARSLNLSPNGASASWIAANRAIYIPIALPFDYPVRRVFWGNGSVAAGNSCFGIYSASGARIYTTGSVANAGASALQFVNTNFILPAGTYFFAFVNDGTTNRVWLSSSVSTQFGRHMGLRQEAAALPLPATMTPAAWASTGYPLVGVTRVP